MLKYKTVQSKLNPVTSSESLDFRISGSLDFRISGFPDLWISGFPDFRISGFLDFRISGFLDFRISGFLDVWISGFPDFWISGARTPRRPPPRAETRAFQSGAHVSETIVFKKASDDLKDYFFPFWGRETTQLKFH